MLPFYLVALQLTHPQPVEVKLRPGLRFHSILSASDDGGVVVVCSAGDRRWVVSVSGSGKCRPLGPVGPDGTASIRTRVGSVSFTGARVCERRAGGRTLASSLHEVKGQSLTGEPFSLDLACGGWWGISDNCRFVVYTLPGTVRVVDIDSRREETWKLPRQTLPGVCLPLAGDLGFWRESLDDL